jgi:hypothetical protein
MEAIQPYLPLIIQLAAGAVGGNIVGAVRGAGSFGPLINSLFGAAGGFVAVYGAHAGGIAEQLTPLLGGNAHLTDGVAGLLGGFVLPLLASFFKRGS